MRFYYKLCYLGGRIYSVKGQPALGGRKISGFRAFFDREELSGYFLNFEDSLSAI